ncbi:MULTISPECIES: CesT family type III secretion system chaperone [Burkholderia]|uniref:CesT family type III secretion system chaperone n=1 Tax=Burkholderia TaxID=32008 RepID=UPI00075AAC85|nr:MULTISPECIES: CesT family type III secretion system chaperone [Burkholderia]AOJ73529.1 hypothetical protein WS78_32340 [Burkholderia savannae]KVG38930.1 hypothetical protein WS77_20475 [Burkholderia sp. MSMB0265]KVG81655.1 hypothetical protein WS81_02220 [Burkholderia sp. MSMB2040]KVG98813.1 hypothetical protein WS83_27790 [Burkholderia sp. MSMB2042]KVG98993.1 hypothetical protein WS82_25670 [Burkholderia sp. MSMB2041]
MYSLLSPLYEIMGLEWDDEDLVLFFDENLAVHFDESPTGLEMVCPLGALPEDPETLKRLLQYNYAGSVILAADADEALLLALSRVSGERSGEELHDALKDLVGIANRLKSELRLD